MATRWRHFDRTWTAERVRRSRLDRSVLLVAGHAVGIGGCGGGSNGVGSGCGIGGSGLGCGMGSGIGTGSGSGSESGIGRIGGGLGTSVMRSTYPPLHEFTPARVDRRGIDIAKDRVLSNDVQTWKRELWPVVLPRSSMT